MSPSLTYWNRIEPRPRSSDFKHGLSAQIRDPAWLLARQWQLGEFQAEDAGSPAYIHLITQLSDLQIWQAGSSASPINGAPLEELVESEAFTPDLALRAEIGQTFEMLLDQRGAAADIGAFRQAYPLPLVWRQTPAFFTLTDNIAADLDAGGIPETLRAAFTSSGRALSAQTSLWTNIIGAEWALTDTEHGATYAIRLNNGEFAVYRLLDHDTLPFLRVCHGRVIDGIALLQAFQASETLPNGVTLRDEAEAALEELGEWYADLIRLDSSADSAAWQADRLEYQVDVFARDTQTSDYLRLCARPERDGTFDWHTFDLGGAGILPTLEPPRAARENTAYAQPTRLTVRGTPNLRWWEFEHNQIDIGAIQPEKRDLSRVLMMDFMLIAGNDWFILPYVQPLGTVCWVDLLAVHDVFGGMTRIQPAVPASGAPRAARWSMFTHSLVDNPNRLAPFFVLPPTTGGVLQEGEVLEEVRFSRDEMANLVWAVEEMIENGVGIPNPGREADMAEKPAFPPTPSTQALQYRVQTSVPSHWIPFVPVELSAERAGRVKLEMAGLLDARNHTPLGRILRPANVSGAYRIWEEEIPRDGMRLSRYSARSRWVNGETYVWNARRTALISEHATIALLFDQVSTDET